MAAQLAGPSRLGLRGIKIAITNTRSIRSRPNTAAAPKSGVCRCLKCRASNFIRANRKWAGNGVYREGAVEGAKLVTRYEGNARITEAAIPWRELPDVAALMRAKKPVKFSFRVNHAGGGPTMELASERGVARTGTQTFHVDWVEHWANELEFGWE